jgi:hypothetical protein
VSVSEIRDAIPHATKIVVIPESITKQREPGEGVDSKPRRPGLMVGLGALGRESVLALILGSNYPDISISVPDICKVFPVNFLREFCEKSLRHSSFLR